MKIDIILNILMYINYEFFVKVMSYRLGENCDLWYINEVRLIII